MSKGPVRRPAMAAIAAFAVAALLAACGGGDSNESSADTAAADAGEAKIHTVVIEKGSFQSGGLNSALYADIGKILGEDSNPWDLPSGSDLELLSCEPALNEPGQSGGCAFAVKGEKGGFALEVTTNSGGSAANWVAAGTTKKPGF